MSRVAVLGAGGRVGRLLVDVLARSGHDVTAVVRDASARTERPATGPSPGAVDVRIGDVRDAGSVRAAIEDHDALVSVVGPPGRRSLSLYSDAARAIVDAAMQARVRRVVVMSSAGVQHDDPGFALWYRVVSRTLLRELYADMAAMERIVRTSDLDWTIVRPSRIADAPATGRYRVADARVPVGGTQVPAGDLARFVAKETESARWLHAAPTVAT